MDTLKNIVPNPVRLDVGGERLEVSPRAAKHFPAMMAAAAPILKELAAGNLAYALARNVRAVQELVAVCVERDVGWVAGLNLRDQTRLLKACWEANAPFFAEEVLPMITELLESMTDVLGPLSSMGLSVPATDSKPSSGSPLQD
jgi:hypothetical protein